MRNLIRRATTLLFGALIATSVMMTPASAQTDEECFETVTTSSIEIVETTGLVITEPVSTEYEQRPGQSLVVPEFRGVEVFTEELVSVPCDPTSTPPDEVLGLAITGSSVKFPVALGFGLIGAGGIAIAAAKRREDNDEG